MLTFARRPAGAVGSELPNAPTGTIIELSPAANAIAQDIAKIIAQKAKQLGEDSIMIGNSFLSVNEID